MSLVWVIGSGGLLGQSLITELRKRSVTLFEPDVKFNWSNTNLVCEELRLAMNYFFLSAAQNQWTIYWVAGQGNMHSKQEDLQEETHILWNFISILLNKADLNLSVGTFIFASSAGAVYAGVQDILINKSTLPVPINAYGRTKILQESLVTKLNKANQGATVIIYRLSTLYGFKKNNSAQKGLLIEITRRILSNEVVHIYVPLETMRDYITAENAAKRMLHTTSLLHENPGVHMKIIASGISISIASILDIFKKISKRNIKVVTQADNKKTQYQRVIQFESNFDILNNERVQENIVVGVSNLLSAMREHIAQNGRQY